MVGSPGAVNRSMDLKIDNYVRGVEGWGPHEIVTERLDADGEKFYKAFFSPIAGFDWNQYEEQSSEDVELQDFHKMLERQIKSWRGGRDQLRVTGAAYWPTFHDQVVEAVEKKLGGTLKLYRGLYGGYAKELLQGTPLRIRRYNAWTTDFNYAKNWAINHASSGEVPPKERGFWIVIEVRYKAKDAVFAPVVLPGYEPNPRILTPFASEDEVVVEDKRKALKRSDYRIPAKSRKALAASVALRYAGTG